MRALVTDVIHESGIELLRSYSEVDILLDLDADKFQNIVNGYDILIGRSTPLTPRIEYPVLENCHRLKVIGIASVGLDQVDQNYVKDKGIKLVHLPGINSQSVAEHTFALLLSLRRHVFSAYEEMKKGNWNKNKYLSARDIFQNTIGIIGLGNIGSHTARIANNGFQMNVLCYDPYVSTKECRAKGATKVSLDTLLKQSDIVTIHAPLTDETYHMIGEEQLQIMKKGSTLINIGRGGIVNEEALYNALLNGPIQYGALDVQEEEPLYNSPLFTLPNFIATPHIGGLTQNYYLNAGNTIVKKCLLACGIEITKQNV
ncbi:NAD(P)-dependent oxidoreductase [Alkalihalobacillus sp. BA299]|uniref:NAD(P)-dependent oxidoreductase n=1 Tax=Alkalihalobacillus sp. BA299 TaxID=2815938 RepID=UPI001ADBFFCE|nr:NAD(P)-dependent oxidoreductase [Alkalihalobacillus sp. BA299]